VLSLHPPFYSAFTSPESLCPLECAWSRFAFPFYTFRTVVLIPMDTCFELFQVVRRVPLAPPPPPPRWLATLCDFLLEVPDQPVAVQQSSTIAVSIYSPTKIGFVTRNRLSRFPLSLIPFSGFP